jgi:AraC family transcriptional activator of pyochelin receptor
LMGTMMPQYDGDQQKLGHAFQNIHFSNRKGVAGTKALQAYTLRPGLVLTVANASMQGPFHATFDVDDAPIQFGFTICGQNRCIYAGGALNNVCHEMSSGSNGIFYLPHTSGYIEQPSNNPACVIGIVASTQLLRTYFLEDMDQLPRRFQAVLEGRKAKPMVWFGPRHPAKHGILMSILNCPYQGGLRRLFLENRVIELLTFQLNDYIASESGSAAKCAPLRPEDVDRIQTAKDILIKDMENPPTIPKLAAQVGINEKKLKTGFRQVYNTSVFGYFREYRLQKAYEILQQADSNVTEAAYAVGYQSLSHFSQSFRQRFGLVPKDFLSRHRRLTTHVGLVQK